MIYQKALHRNQFTLMSSNHIHTSCCQYHLVLKFSYVWRLLSFVLACLGFLSPNCETFIDNCVYTQCTYKHSCALWLDTFLLTSRVLQWKNNLLIIAFLYTRIVFGISLISSWSCTASLFITLLAFLLSFQHFRMYLDFTVVPVKIFRDLIPLGFINWMKNTIICDYSDGFWTSRNTTWRSNMSRGHYGWCLIPGYVSLLILTFQLYLQVDIDFCSLYPPHLYLDYPLFCTVAKFKACMWGDLCRG